MSSYKLAIDQALKVSSIKNGFRSVGLFPRMSADEWLSINATKHSIKMNNTEGSEPTMTSEEFRRMRREEKRTFNTPGLSKKQFAKASKAKSVYDPPEAP